MHLVVCFYTNAYYIIKGEEIMKRFFVFVLISVLISCLMCSCTVKQSEDIAENDYLDTISALEAELEQLKLAQNERDAESERRIAELTEQLNALRREENTESNCDTEDTEPVGFKYTVEGGNATVTGYTGSEMEIVIPKTIDGYKVTAIGERAFENMSIKSVIISDGVESIGWFAFNGCMKLNSVIVPSSVTEIGYSAFGSSVSSLTLFCHSDSYALSFAKSFGLTYVVI